MTRMLVAALLFTTAFGAAACNTAADDASTDGALDEQSVAENATPEIIERIGGQDSEGSESSGDSETSEVTTSTTGMTATVISRLPATATPTQPPDPLQPVASDVLAGVVVPLGAELLKHTMATDSTDASADYAIAGIDNETLLEWFRENMIAIGWAEDDERDGALIFLHDEQLSMRHPDEPRGATVFFATVEGLPESAGSFTIIVELPYDEDAEAASESETDSGDGDGEGDDGADDAADEDDADEDEEEETEDEESSDEG